ncbi:hypothetical protein [Sporomusa sp. KB1]|jgi:hypothetical protein|nr:hypothetical protein [Sporomusa sp. KB1]
MEQSKLTKRLDGYRRKTITHLEYGEPCAMKVACPVREGAG